MSPHIAISSAIEPGRRVRITQQIVLRDQIWTQDVEGEIVELPEEPSGSWFAGGRDGQLWLSRVILRKADGELTDVALDINSKVQIF